MSLRIVAAVAAVLALAGAAAAQVAPGSEPVRVMVLGTFHLGNPGLDRHNPVADDVLSPRRQAELASLSERLAEFAPTKIFEEREVPGPAFIVPAYAGFTDDVLARERGEDVQIGFRLARRLGHAAVYGLDERPGAGEPDYFPIGPVQAFAKETGRLDRLATASAPLRALVARLAKEQPTRDLSDLLLEANDPALVDRLHRSAYYGLLSIGDGDRQPGADLNAMWYLRNAKMFAKAAGVVRPGDRVLIVVGAGHAYWLRHFAQNTPGYALVEPSQYLAADKPSP